MKNSWMSAVVLAVALAVSACGGTQEAPEETAQEQGNAEAQLYPCTDDGRCPSGYYCDGNACRRGAVEAMPYQCTTEGLCPKGYYCDGGPGGICRRILAE
ncbi:hypothetical protein [Archangium lipolyticum]|uniref:hypothetical protein n=1 Tax=Archangium lipolyticum TaxID=2970465 RepID=UPI002149F4A1|nr:hypothetical protein [Archangium lipolyticum]